MKCPYCEKKIIPKDFWATQRPLTHYWGSGQIYNRICNEIGKPDVVFGKTDNIPDDVFAVDKNNGYNWNSLPFKDNEFEFGYWDPPYPPNVKGLMKNELQEIWRVCNKLAILHPYIYPSSWLKDCHRIGMIGVTFGPMKVIRCLQIFKKKKQI